MTISEYLYQHYQPKTAKCYLRDISIFLEHCPNADSFDYKAVLDYLEELRKQQKASSLHRILQGIKKYYQYLVYQKDREDNPAASIYLKDHKSSLPILPKMLLTAAELEQAWDWILKRKSRYKLLKNRNVAMLGLLLYQGLRAGEFARLELKDLNMLKASIYLTSTHRSAARTIALQAPQILPFYHYLEDRQQLITNPTNTLFVNKLGQPETGETIHYLVQQLRPLFPTKKINPKIIRQSVIAHQFELGHKLSEVQYFAGHHFPDSTERYNLTDLEHLQQAIEKHHPLKDL